MCNGRLCVVAGVPGLPPKGVMHVKVSQVPRQAQSHQGAGTGNKGGNGKFSQVRQRPRKQNRPGVLHTTSLGWVLGGNNITWNNAMPGCGGWGTWVNNKQQSFLQRKGEREREVERRRRHAKKAYR